ncbi:MAG: flagellar biosynthetic protein FliR [Beijerinckiaceae bacterium]
MIAQAADTVLMTLVVLCRIGSCLMFIPGFSSTRVPVRVRLFIALSISAAVAPLIALPGFVSAIEPNVELARIILAETAFGVLLGLLCRFIFNALEVMGEVISMAIGLTNNLGAPIESNEVMPTLSALISLTASLLFLVLDLHWEIFRGIVNSYAVVPLGVRIEFRSSLIELVDVAGFAFTAALKIAGPFLIFSLIANFAFGLVNKMIPQIPIYFVSMPFILSGGTWLFFAISKSAFKVFIVMFSLWLSKL